VQPFSLLVKPASADCNLRCEYCFYLGHASLYPETPRHRMSDGVLESMIRSYLETPQPTYQFGWQGGEPTLMGLPFFRRVVELQQRYGHSGAIVANGLQTNATLITDELAAHLAQYRFLVGVSLDGPRELHDRYRRSAAGEGSWDQVMLGIERLTAQGVDFNILTLVNETNVAHARTVYAFLRDRGFLHHQYIPCVEQDGGGGVRPCSVSGVQWGHFLCELFDAWYPGDTERVSIRLFDSVLSLLVDGVRNVCSLGHNCAQYFVVEYGGDVYPCDFFVDRRLRLGNVTTDAWAAMQSSPVYREFGARKCQWHSRCEACKFQDLCVGDCLKHRLVGVGEDPRRVSLLCEGWNRFYGHTLDRFRDLAARIVARRRGQAVGSDAPGRGAERAGRNDACPCGSGRKYKKCCGR